MKGEEFFEHRPSNPPLPEGLAAELGASVGKFKTRQLVTSAFLFAAGATMLALSWPAASGNWGTVEGEKGITLAQFFRYGGILLAVLALVAVAVIVSNATRRRKVLEAATGRPEEVAWVYLERILLPGMGESGLALRPHIQLRDGTHAWFQVNRSAAEEVLEFYERESPGVCLGYERGLRRRLRRDPEGLARDPVRTDKVKVTHITYLYRV
ncbi:hypothetical protein [Candidatus Solincola tengchongensis]|uniref:hypothetical protein n=1 Tax=Candidatus Solincola tengchongensis TaxID=2900693 RepID=UPI00257D64D7|nr:hypothetical protein [Candidatus Solincola tengchongensis]